MNKMEFLNTQGYVALVLYLLGAAMYVVLFEDADTGGPTAKSTFAGLLWPYVACTIVYSFIRGDIESDGE